MSKYSFDAVIFDLDGVVTQTALVHSKAWKKMFDSYLKEREKKYGEHFREFTHENDYLTYVDGKPRYKGVESFLKSRAIEIPYGNPDDTYDKETICGIGNRKNKVFNDVLARDGVKIYDSTINLIKELKKEGIKIGVASSSKNCKAVLDAARITDIFETRVDGIVSAKLKLHGKPEPDIFTTACDNLNVNYDRAVVVEDAISGVQAGHNGNFGLVIGIARENNEKELKLNGADIVVRDLEEINGVNGIEKWFKQGLNDDMWSLNYYDYEPKKERSREALLTVGNGYFGTRGALEETKANEINYPGTYIAGVYNRLKSSVAKRTVINEDFVNCTNWLPVNFKINNDNWFNTNDFEIVNIHRKLNFKNGLLYKKMIVKDNKGRKTLIESKRIASMDNPHLASLKYYITPLNYSDKITIKTGIDGNIINAGVERYKQLNSRHLEPLSQGIEKALNYVLVKTNQSNIIIAEASKINVLLNNKKINHKINSEVNDASSYSYFELNLKENDVLSIDKIVSIHTSLDKDKQTNTLQNAKNDIVPIHNFEEVLKRSEKKWSEIWKEIDIKIEGDRLAQKLLRMHLYHLMVCASIHNVNIDAGITARGLHGEAYRGHIFWDELFILPFYEIHFKDIAKSLLLYRYRRLDKAREYAKEYGYKGAMFPWQSGSDGREETQTLHLNPISGKWGDDYSSLQRHVSLSIAYNIWQYFQINNDLDFLEKYGAEIFLEICRFWASKSNYNEETQRYEIKNVMGPDEFHEKYPHAKKGGIKDNTYTNLMVVWSFKKAFKILDLIDETSKNIILKKIKLDKSELDRWNDISKKMNIVISDDGILSQYDGYFDLKELDWDSYRKKYSNIYRMDRILKAEGKSADDYKVAKQADTLMIFYNLDSEEVTDILNELGYKMNKNYLKKNFEYYLKRTSHGSTLSRVVHSQLANMIGRKQLSWKLYMDALTSDYNDIQGGTTGEGIHCGVMAGTVLIALNSYAGLNLRTEKVKINPNLPENWRKISFNFIFKDNHYYMEITHKDVNIKLKSKKQKTVDVIVYGKKYTLKNNEWEKIN